MPAGECSALIHKSCWTRRPSQQASRMHSRRPVVFLEHQNNNWVDDFPLGCTSDSTFQVSARSDLKVTSLGIRQGCGCTSAFGNPCQSSFVRAALPSLRKQTSLSRPTGKHTSTSNVESLSRGFEGGFQHCERSARCHLPPESFMTRIVSLTFLVVHPNDPHLLSLTSRTRIICIQPSLFHALQR